MVAVTCGPSKGPVVTASDPVYWNNLALKPDPSTRGSYLRPPGNDSLLCVSDSAGKSFGHRLVSAEPHLP